ncbi:hypothetical protein HC891_27870 [Candidatus Gracilibacteria bacterium]|nr:hypothetical protein [Candidatus Gracilibacteria bacterium]
MALFLHPGLPYFLVALAGGGLTLLGATLYGRYHLFSSVFVGVLAASLLLLAAGGASAALRQLLTLVAALALLVFGVWLPRRPAAIKRREAAQIRLLTPGFISFIRVALSSFEPPIEAMRRYCERPAARALPMQLLVAESLQLSLDKRLRPLAALATVARRHTCRELIEVAEALAQAEAEGGRIEQVLAAQQTTLELILQSEFKRMLSRRTIYLLLMVAISLVVGLLFNLLFVMTGGGTVFSSF